MDDAGSEDAADEPDSSERRHEPAFDEDQTAVETAIRQPEPEIRQQPMVVAEAPSFRPEREPALADSPAEPDVVNGAPPEQRQPEQRQPEHRQPEPEPEEPMAVVLTPPDPDRPKRAGWWSKAKAAITGS